MPMMNHGDFGDSNYSSTNVLMVVMLVKVTIKMNVFHGNFSNGHGLDKMMSQLKVGMLKELKEKLHMNVPV